jgi:hypothetical protein
MPDPEGLSTEHQRTIEGYLLSENKAIQALGRLLASGIIDKYDAWMRDELKRGTPKGDLAFGVNTLWASTMGSLLAPQDMLALFRATGVPIPERELQPWLEKLVDVSVKGARDLLEEHVRRMFANAPES